MMTIDTSNRINIDGNSTGLAVTQRREKTVVYTPECASSGRKYQEHTMPHARYSTAHDKPASGAAGRAQFEADILELAARLGG
jgi:hypothetical protein